jgi:hypothetical protein
MASAIKGDVRIGIRDREKWMYDRKGVKDEGRTGGVKVMIARMNDYGMSGLLTEE